MLITILIGMLGGIAVGLQTPIANVIGRHLGSISSSVVVHISGAVFSLIVLAFYRGENLQNWRVLPWWTYVVGVLGLLLFLTINFTIPRIGTTAAISLIIVGQLIAGVVIDQFGLFGVDIRTMDSLRLLGVALLITGSYLIIR